MNHWGVEIWLSITMFSWPFFFSNFVQFYQKMLILFLFPPHNYTETTDAILVIDAKLQNYLFGMCSISISRCFLRHLFFDKLRLCVAFWIRLLIQFTHVHIIYGMIFQNLDAECPLGWLNKDCGTPCTAGIRGETFFLSILWDYMIM